jgi:hypothetical protein
MAERGADLAYGRTLPRLFRESDLTDVSAEAYFPIASPACAIRETATIRHVRDQLLAADLATPERSSHTSATSPAATWTSCSHR